jgi:small subunit ribosomal protein S14
MKNGNQMDQRRRRLCQTWEASRRLLKAMCREASLSPSLRQEAMSALAKLPRNSSPTRVRNRCSLTGRSRGVSQDFRLSRMKLRQLAAQGLLPGVFKASW